MPYDPTSDARAEWAAEKRAQDRQRIATELLCQRMADLFSKGCDIVAQVAAKDAVVLADALLSELDKDSHGPQD